MAAVNFGQVAFLLLIGATSFALWQLLALGLVMIVGSFFIATFAYDQGSEDILVPYDETYDDELRNYIL